MKKYMFNTQFMIYFYKIFRKISYFFNVSFSFSSDGEDYTLLKIFEHIDVGNYIDIGSNHPILHSNTYSLYLKGWLGVCVDPLPYLVPKYKKFRFSDKFYNKGFLLGNESINAPFYFFPDNPDNSTFDLNQVKLLNDEYNRSNFKVLDVSFVSVDEIINNFNINSPIHLISIDVEGLEYEILQEFIGKNIFPWVFCVEELSFVAYDISTSKVYKYLTSKGYKLISRTFLSSIYILDSALPNLINNNTKIWNLYK